MPNGRTRVTPEWTGAITTLSMVVTIGTITAALYWAQAVFIPIALAVVMTFVLSPAVTRLQRWGLGRTPSVAITMTLTLVVLVSVGTVVAQQLAKLGNELPDHAPNILTKVQSAKLWLFGTDKSRFGQLIEDVGEIVTPGSRDGGTQPITVWGMPVHSPAPAQRVVVEKESGSWFDSARTVLGPAGELLGTLALSNVLVIFMLLRREDLRNRMIRLIGHGRVTTTTKAVDDAATRISRYLLTQLALNAAFSVVIAVGLTIIGLPYPVLWAFVSFLMRYVPYVGTWIGVIPPALFSLAVSEGWGQPAAVIALFIGLELICNNVFEPMLYGSSLGISEVAQLVAAAFWAFLWGPIGLILSGPLTVCLLVLGKYVHRLAFLEILLGDEPALTPRMAFYQRLAARDQDEASIIALERAKEDGTPAVFDNVVIPALALAKRDYQAGLLNEENWEQALTAAREVAHELQEFDESKATDTPTPAPKTSRIPILLVPARDEADRVAMEILTQRLDHRWDPELVTDSTLASELVEMVRKSAPLVVVIGSLPPAGLAHTRYLVSRIRTADPNIKILVGRWGFSDELGEESETTGIPGVDSWSDSIATTLHQLNEWSPVLRETTEATANGTPTPRKGTPAIAVGV